MVVVGLGESSFGDRLEEETRRVGSPRGDDMGSLGEKLETQMAVHLLGLHADPPLKVKREVNAEAEVEVYLQEKVEEGDVTQANMAASPAIPISEQRVQPICTSWHHTQVRATLARWKG